MRTRARTNEGGLKCPLRAQASVEIIIILASLLLVFGLILNAAGLRLGDTRTFADNEMTGAGVSGIAAAADEVYAEGVGSQRLVKLSLPASVVQGRSFVDGHLLGVQLLNARGPTDINARAGAPMQGSLPDTPGDHQVRVKAAQGFVIIGETSLSIEPTLLYAYLGKTGESEAKLTIINTGNEPLTLSLSLDWPNQAVSAALDQTSLSLQPGEARTVSVKFASGETAGTYAGELVLDASNGEQFNVGVMADVLA
ncbi:Uncharacterised protein [Candidatus Burarchaeum australiense]|nr:Uncharacterised protein [Candidatus Burarchaeum australiense]